MFQKTKTGSVELKRSLTGNVAVHTLKGGIKGTFHVLLCVESFYYKDTVVSCCNTLLASILHLYSSSNELHTISNSVQILSVIWLFTYSIV
jgi:hypothetical protein